MSMEDARACIEKLEHDEAFRETIASAPEAERLELMRRGGFEFSRDEMRSVVRAQLEQELSEDELEDVAGGLSGEIKINTVVANILSILFGGY